jgi:hypothetical protein
MTRSARERVASERRVKRMRLRGPPQREASLGGEAVRVQSVSSMQVRGRGGKMVWAFDPTLSGASLPKTGRSLRAGRELR